MDFLYIIFAIIFLVVKSTALVFGLTRELQIISHHFLSEFQIILVEEKPHVSALTDGDTNSVFSHEFLGVTMSACFVNSSSYGKLKERAGLCHHLAGGDGSWKIISLIRPKEYSDIFNVIELISWDFTNWTYFILFPSPSPQIFKLKLKRQLENQKDRLGPALPISCTLLILFPQEASSVKAIMEYPVFGLSIYKIKNDLFMSEVSFARPITADDILEVQMRRQDFGGTFIRAVGVHQLDIWENALIMPKAGEGKVTFGGGFESEAINYIAQSLNFRLEALATDEFFNNYKTGSLTGMAKLVTSNRADIGVSATYVLAWRVNHVDFLQPSSTSRIQGFMRPAPRSVGGNVFFKAFQMDTWKMYFATILGLAIAILLLVKVKKTISTENIPNDNSDGVPENEAFMWAAGVACQQGWYLSPKSTSQRIIFISGYMLGLVCFIGYSANLISIMSHEKPPIKSLREWEELGWKLIPDPAPQALDELEKVHKVHFVWNVSEEVAIMRILSGQTIYLSSTLLFNPVVRKYFREHSITATSSRHAGQVDGDKAVCLLVCSIHVDWSKVKAAMFVNKRSPLRGFLQQKTILLLQSGVQERNLKIFENEGAFHCAEDHRADVRRPLEMRDVLSSFLLFCAGSLASFVFLMIEIVFRYYSVSGNEGTCE